LDPRLISQKLENLRGIALTPLSSIDAWSCRTAQHQGPDAYDFKGQWKRTGLPCTVKAGETIFFRTEITIPPSTDLSNTFLVFSIEEIEGLLRINGDAHAGIDANHTRIAIPRRGKLKLDLEFLSVPRLFCNPELAGSLGRLLSACICRVNHDIETFCADIDYAQKATAVCPDERRRELLDAAIEAALIEIDLTLPHEELLKDVGRARAVLKRKLAGIAPDPEAGRAYAIGHSHIDTAWLWPIRETIRKCGRTFSTACRLLEQHEHYYFSCSQPQLYQYTRTHFPEVYRQIKKWVKTGRWGTDGAMWVEPDCNMTSGESLVRQLMYGLDFFKREFGTRTRICWLPDVFGYNASLPQILKGAGIDYFYTYKLHWQARNFFPHSLFRWRGLDGSEIIAHIPKTYGAYNGTPDPFQLTKAWEDHQQKRDYPEVLFPYGYGDGGGGPTDEMLHMVTKSNHPGIPAMRTGTLNRFFKDIEKADPELPVWDGELYLETHRGTLSTQGAMKRANRKSELLLRDAEIYASLAQLAGKRVSTRPLRQAWETTCLHQFHDILPGSSIGMVYDEALADHETLQQTAGQVRHRALQALAPPSKRQGKDAVCTFNSLGWERSDLVSAEVSSASVKSVIGPDGIAHPVQLVGRTGRKAVIVFEPGNVSAMGYQVLQLSKKAVENATVMSVTKARIETPCYRIRINKDGAITSLYDKTHKREIIASKSLGNDLQLFQDGPEHEDAWNIHDTYKKRRYPFEGSTTLQVIENGPVRGVLRVTRKHRDSIFEQDIVVYAKTPRIDFVTRADWHQQQMLLKVAFPLAIRSRRASYEVQFGAVERATHSNTSWEEEMFEVAAQRWVDLSEAGYGVSLMNDCKYGHDIRENVVRITLLRGTTWPDPQADQGEHEFTYSLYPHAGNWTDADTVRRAWELNVPACVTTTTAAPESSSGLSVDGSAIVETLKPAENGKGLILRVYEPHGSRGPVTVRVPVHIKRVKSCNLVEEDEQAIPLRAGSFRFKITPFQIRTFRIQ
jgi:alpha-mannosidase